MSRLARPFKGLRWKLTLSYTAVTVATLMVVEILLILGVGFIIVNSNLLPNLMITGVETFITPQVVTFLDRPDPDLQGLTEWLDFAYSEGVTFQSARSPNIRLELGDLDQDATLLVLNQNLDLLVGRPELSESEVIDLYEQADELIMAALGEGKAVSLESNGQLITSVPVIGGEGQVLGAVLMIIAYPPRGSLLQLFSLIGVSLILFTLVTGMIGTIFGYFTARGLSKRLRTVSQAADMWSAGDFTAFIQDRSEDELGQLAHQLNRMAEQLQNLLQTKQELATLEERNRLARDLHDSVKQQVFATMMQLAAARAVLTQDPEIGLEHLNQADKLARQAQSELTAIILELRPGTLKDKGFAQALKEYSADWSRLNKIEAQITIKDECYLPVEVEQTLFRVAQECLSNIARHSQANRVEILLDCGPDELSLMISDDGVGFEPSSAVGKGLGLRSMRERMQAIGGSLSLVSAPGQGARLAARCKITKGSV